MGFDTKTSVYHGPGTSSPITEFEPGRAGLTYFSENPDYSKGYASGGNPVGEFFLKKGKQFDTVGNPKHKKQMIKLFNDRGGWKSMAEADGYSSAKEYFSDVGGEGRNSYKYDERYDEDWEILDDPETDILGDLFNEGYESFRFQERRPSAEYHDGVVTQAVADPSRIRSVDAAFDPEKKDSGNILASGAPVSAGILGAGAALTPEEAEAGFLTTIPNLIRTGMLNPIYTENATQLKKAMNKYDKAMRGSTAFRAREKLRSDIENQTTSLDIGERKILDPNDLIGKVGVPVVGDPSVTGKKLQTIGGVDLDSPIEIEGGSNFPLRYEDQGYGWASMKTAADKKQANFLNAQKITDGSDPVGIFSAMGRDSLNFSTPIANAMYSQAIKLPLAKADIEEFDRNVRYGPKNSKAKEPKGISRWVGLNDPDALDQLLGEGKYQREGSGELRKYFVEVMESAKFRDRGFPLKEDVYAEAIQPELQSAQIGDAGFSIFDAVPGSQTFQKEGVHKSYDTVIPGTYLGGLEQNIPSRVMFPKVYEDLDARKNTKNEPFTESQKTGSLVMRNDLYQPLDEQWAEGVSNYMRGQKGSIDPRLAAGLAATSAAAPTLADQGAGIMDFLANAAQGAVAPISNAPNTIIQALTSDRSNEQLKADRDARLAANDYQLRTDLGQQYTQNAQETMGGLLQSLAEQAEQSRILEAVRNSRILQTIPNAYNQIPERGRIVGNALLDSLL